MMHFSVKDNVGWWKPTSHQCRLFFNELTKTSRQSNDRHPRYPLSIYKFIPFVDVLNSPYVAGPDLIDIIGAFNPREGVKKPAITEGPSKWNSFYIRDLENRRLHYTLWDGYVDQFTNYLSTPKEDLVIVLLQLCCISERWRC